MHAHDTSAWRRWLTASVVAVCSFVCICGCSRWRYRVAADNDTIQILRQETRDQAWTPPIHFGIDPPPESRLFDPSDPDFPILPAPIPQLYGYSPELPLATRSVPPGSRPDVAAVGALPDAVKVEVPEAYWSQIPGRCLTRMFAFESVREEYERTHSEPPPGGLLDSSPRLTLQEIVAQANLNSRELQTQKELLYRAALQLSLERYDYELRFSPFGNGITSVYQQIQSGGSSLQAFDAFSSFELSKVLATGGQLVGRFANEVLLTFDGPNGFVSDIGSELIFDLSQSLVQRDIVFERLTQAERNVVYAARDYARFRKLLFFDLAASYFSLVRTYRQVEIDSQNYFTLVRALTQAQAEFTAGFVDRVQLEQIEQNMLAGRATLLRTCRQLESSLDRLKITMGLPTETPIQLDLAELSQLTSRDQLAVNGELVRRVLERLNAELERDEPNQGTLASSGAVLAERMMMGRQLRGQPAESVAATESWRILRERLRVEEAQLEVAERQHELEAQKTSLPPASPTAVFQRTMDLIATLRLLLERQQQLALELGLPSSDVQSLAARRQRLADSAERVRRELDEAVDRLEVARVPEFVRRAELILDEAQQDVSFGQQITGMAPNTEGLPRLQRLIAMVSPLMADARQFQKDLSDVLVPVELQVDDAMYTALVERFEVMNARGRLADDRRRIKLAADDLKSILNLNVRQVIGTPLDSNRPFAFTFDESRTEVRATLDLPLNRRLQRNTYRESLINYQAGLRSLTRLEDDIKFAVREDLRDLELANESYLISIASAALAYERVVSTLLELQLGFRNVAARDFLEAQDAYTRSLGGVADNHITYVVGRMRLFLDLELLRVNDDGFWHEIGRDELLYATDPPPAPGTAYGRLPHGVIFSRQMRHALRQQAGQ